MLRTLLVGILALSAVPSCGSKEAAPAATPGAPAGKVLELTGTVTATRGTEVRTLTQGGEISVDDVIGTAPESRVTILIAHNNAHWDLGPGRKVKVGESLAWTASKQTGPAAVVKEETSTAGRYAEKTAATTTTTTAAAAERSPGPGGTAPAATAEPMAQPAPTEETVATTTETPVSKGASRKNEDAKKPMQPSTGARPGATMPEPVQPSPPPPAKDDPVDDIGGDGETADPGKRTKAKQATEASRKPEKNVVGNDKDDEGPDLLPKGGDSGSSIGGEGRSGGGGSLGAARPSTPLEIEIRATLSKQSAALKACLGTGLSRLALTVTVKDGIYTIQTSDAKATAEARACLAKIAKTLKATTKGNASVPHAIGK